MTEENIIQRKQLEAMNTRELEDLYDELAEAIAKIKGQIEFAKSEAAATGEYADRRWFNSATYALRMKSLSSQRVEQELTRRRKNERIDANLEMNRRFIDAAKRRLEPELFNSLMSDAIATTIYHG